MRLRGRIHNVLIDYGVPDENFYLSRAIAEAVSTTRAAGYKGTFRKDREKQKPKPSTTQHVTLYFQKVPE